MFSVDALLESAFPQQTLPAWKRKLLKRLLHEKISNSLLKITRT